MTGINSQVTMLNSFPAQQNVDVVSLNGKSVYLVGTAHISQASADLADQVIREVKPDAVAVELCAARHESLRDPEKWRNMDIVAVIRQGKAYLLMAQLMLAAFQRKLGNQLNIKPGAEMMAALAAAKNAGCGTILADRDITITLKRTWASIGFWSMLKLTGVMLHSLFSQKEITAEEIERLKSTDALEELLREFSDKLPGVRSALIDERDQYLAARIQSAPGKAVVAVIGAGHVPGIKRWLGQTIDTAPLEVIPPRGKFTRLIGWGIPALVMAMVIGGFFSSGAGTSVEMMRQWFIINGSFGGMGAILALAHPFTVISAFLAAPFTALHPLLASGWVAGLVEAIIHKPRVADFDTIIDDVSTLRGLFRNRLSHILLVVASTNLLGTIGALIGIKRMAALL